MSVLCWGLTQHGYVPTASRAEPTGGKLEYPCQNIVGGFTPCGEHPGVYLRDRQAIFMNTDVAATPRAP